VPDPLELRDELSAALELAAREATGYATSVGDGPVLPSGASDELAAWDPRLPEDGDGAVAALTELIERAIPSATRSSGPRFFHFVMGGTTPASLGGDWLASALDQVGYAWASSPLAARLEAIATEWLRELFELPREYTGVLVTGATMANLTGLAAARTWWADELGIDVEAAGLAGAPRPTILTSGYIHPSAVQAIGMLGLGRDNIRRLAADAAGRLDLEALKAALAQAGEEPVIVVANAGEVNTGDFDPIAAMAEAVSDRKAWLHVDGAFGLFARLAPSSRHLTNGLEAADSIAADAHKWLNVPYDCGIVIVAHPAAHRAAMSQTAAYLPRAEGEERDGMDWTPEASRRARAIPVYAVLRQLGRRGLADMIERCCRVASRIADRLRSAPGVTVLNDVALNQVLVRFDGADGTNITRGVIAAIQRGGTCWCGGTNWDGGPAMRISVSNWRTSDADADRSAEAIVQAFRSCEQR
jgi:glutamate/tyrosine decarboxylase-like PLP-dependent enzyme